MLKLSNHLTVDPVEYGSRASAILGIRDSGKTYTATKVAEELMENDIPIGAIDPIGVWRFLRNPSNKANAHRGYPVVIVGVKDADIPLSVDTLPRVIEAAMQNGISFVVDLFDPSISKADWRRIVKATVSTLMHGNSQYGLRHIFIEEAAEFVPQRVQDGQTFAVVEQLVRMGGNVGLGCTLINQRAADLNKSCLELCDNLLLHRQKGSNSIQSLKKWLEIGEAKGAQKVVKSLSNLPTGECWAWLRGQESPQLIKIAPKKSYDPDRRQLGKRDGEIGRVPSRVGVEEFVTKITGELAKKAEKAPKAETVVTDSAAIARAHKAGYDEGYAAGRHDVMVRVHTHFEQLRELTNSYSLTVASLAGQTIQSPNSGSSAAGPASTPERDGHPPSHEPPVSKPAAIVAGSRMGAGGSPKSKDGAERLLAVLVSANPIPLSAELWASLAKTAAGSGWWNVQIKTLKTEGLIEQKDGKFTATKAGIDRRPLDQPFHIVESEDELWEIFRDRIADDIGSAGMLLLSALHAHKPALTNEQLGLIAAKAPNSGWWNTAMKALRHWQVIETEGGRHRLSPKGERLMGPRTANHDTAAVLKGARVDNLSGSAARLYKAMTDTITREDLAARANLKTGSGYWNAALKELLESGLVEDRGGVIAMIEEELHG